MFDWNASLKTGLAAEREAGRILQGRTAIDEIANSLRNLNQ
jgi:hypothetical protein